MGKIGLMNGEIGSTCDRHRHMAVRYSSANYKSQALQRFVHENHSNYKDFFVNIFQKHKIYNSTCKLITTRRRFLV